MKLASAVRWGEISALRVGDCMLTDEQTVHMHITRAWKARGETDPAPVNRDEDENANWRLGPPKNGRSRWVTVQGDVALELIAAVQGRHPDEYVFRTTRGNPWRYDDFHSDRWAPAMKLAKERGLTKHMTPHMLRHTAVVWAVAAGVPLAKVSTMLGHASIGITYDRYGGLLNVQDDEMAPRWPGSCCGRRTRSCRAVTRRTRSTPGRCGPDPGAAARQVRTCARSDRPSAYSRERAVPRRACSLLTGSTVSWRPIVRTWASVNQTFRPTLTCGSVRFWVRRRTQSRPTPSMSASCCGL